LSVYIVEVEIDSTKEDATSNLDADEKKKCCYCNAGIRVVAFLCDSIISSVEREEC
jgi:hypothetical protein